MHLSHATGKTSQGWAFLHGKRYCLACPLPAIVMPANLSGGDLSKVITCRTNETAKMSDICERAYSPSSIRALFEGFRLQAENSLLFLKCVTKLSIHVKAAGSQSPQLLFEATASPQVSFSRPHGTELVDFS